MIVIRYRLRADGERSLTWRSCVAVISCLTHRLIGERPGACSEGTASGPVHGTVCDVSMRCGAASYFGCCGYFAVALMKVSHAPRSHFGRAHAVALFHETSVRIALALQVQRPGVSFC